MQISARGARQNRFMRARLAPSPSPQRSRVQITCQESLKGAIQRATEGTEVDCSSCEDECARHDAAMHTVTLRKIASLQGKTLCEQERDVKDWYDDSLPMYQARSSRRLRKPRAPLF